MFSLYAPYYIHKSFRIHVIKPPTYEVYMLMEYSFRRFNQQICMCLCIFFVVFSSPEVSLLDKVAFCRPSARRPSVNSL